MLEQMVVEKKAIPTLGAFELPLVIVGNLVPIEMVDALESLVARITLEGAINRVRAQMLI